MSGQSYKVKLDQFEGPLDLLLHLIQKMEIDIYDIPVSEITDQYLDYIHTMKFLELDVASEYLVMAATLIEIKSDMLLPKPTTLEVDDLIEEDPREQLMQKLLEYRKFKAVAEKFKVRENEEMRTYFRTVDDILKKENKAVTAYEPVPFFELVDAFKNVLQRKSWRHPIERTVRTSEISVEDRMEEIVELLEINNQINFDALFTDYRKSEIVVTFLSVLQLLKENKVECLQNEQFGNLILSRVGVAV